MTCVVFVLLKALQVWSTPYDWAIALGFIGLDVIGAGEWLRIMLYRRDRRDRHAG